MPLGVLIVRADAGLSFYKIFQGYVSRGSRLRSQVFLENHTFPVREFADVSMGHEVRVRDRKGSAGRSIWNTLLQVLQCPVAVWEACSSRETKTKAD